jgi:hypothetical protein
MKCLSLAALAVGVAFAASGAHATTFMVSAMGNSSTDGSGLGSISLTSGELFQVSVDPNDLWSAGPLPRWSNADGLTGNRIATGTDESGETAGTLIGTDFGTWTQNGLTAPFGTLVGEINGVFHVLGTNFSGAAWDTGTLNLFYWDSNNFDNAGSISADVTAAAGVVPEPTSWGMMILGFGMAGAIFRRRRSMAQAA